MKSAELQDEIALCKLIGGSTPALDYEIIRCVDTWIAYREPRLTRIAEFRANAISLLQSAWPRMGLSNPHNSFIWLLRDMERR